MSKKLVGLATAAALVSTVVAPYAIQAEETYTAAGQGVYVTAGEGKENLFYSLTDVATNPGLVVDLIREYGAANVHLVVAGKYATAADISAATSNNQAPADAYSAQTAENDVPAGSYVNTDGESTVVGTPDDTPEENQNETFFYNLAA